MNQTKKMFTEAIAHVLCDVNVWKKVHSLWDLSFILSLTIMGRQARLGCVLICKSKHHVWIRIFSGVKLHTCNNEAGFIKLLKFKFFSFYYPLLCFVSF
jgi:hypothetical protein